jgi:hypothetical protein
MPSARAIRAMVAAPAFAVVASCHHPIDPVLRPAPVNGIQVCWQPEDQGDDLEPVQRELHKAVGQRLADAGYRLVARGCDLQVFYQYTTKGVGLGSFRTVHVVLRDDIGKFMDRFALDFAPSEAPADEPDRVAILLVNGVNDSAKVAAIYSSPAYAPSVGVPPLRPLPPRHAGGD